MVKTDFDDATGAGMIVLRPNNSASWRDNVMFTLSLGTIMLVMAVFFFMQGLWMILPFSGLEIGALFAGLYYVTHKNNRTEVIIFDKEKVTIERGHRQVEDTYEYQRAWSTIFVQEPEHRGHLKKIFIRSYGKELELGSFLNKDDREALIRSLKHVVYA